MVMAAEMSARLGWLRPADRDRVVQLLKRVGLPTDAPRIGAQRGRLLKELGRAVVVDDYAEQAFDATLQAHFG
jgi:3-dehydroquinate synthase